MDLESRNPNAEKNGGIECPTVRWFFLGEIGRQGTLCQPDTGSTGESTSTLGAVLVRERIPWFKFLLIIQKGPKKNLLKTSTVAFSLLCQCLSFLQSPNSCKSDSNKVLKILPVLSKGWSSFSTSLCNTNEKFAPNTKHLNLTSATPFFVANVRKRRLVQPGFHRHRALTQLPQNFTQRFRTKTFWKTWWS